MKSITDFRVKPTLTEITIDDADIVASYGDTVSFYMYDHLDIKTYFEFFKAQSSGDTEQILNIVKTIILDKDAKPVIHDNQQLPIDLFASAVNKISLQLGKSATRNSTSTEVGTQQ